VGEVYGLVVGADFFVGEVALRLSEGWLAGW
jgi:hypothetical protein